MKAHIIIQKNLRILLKYRRSSLLIIFAPLLLIFLAGIAYDHLNEYRVNIGVYSPAYTPLTESWIANLNQGNFKAAKASSESDCIGSIKRNRANACILFPANLTISSQNSSEISIYVDYSKVSVAWVVKDLIFTKVQQKSAELSQNITRDLLYEVTKVKSELEEKRKSLQDLQKDAEGLLKKERELSNITSNIQKNLNLSTIALLESKLSSLKKSSEDLVKKADVLNDYASSMATSKGMRGQIHNAQTALHGEQEYIANLFSEQYKNSVALLMKDVHTSYNLSLQANANSAIKIKEINKTIENDKKVLGKIIDSLAVLNSRLDKIRTINAEAVASPVKTNIKTVTSYNTYLNYVFPTLMVILIMFASILLSSIVIISEKNSNAFFRNSISPTPKETFFIAHFLTLFLIIGCQIMIIVLTASIFFRTQILSSIFSILFACLFISALFILIGMLIGYLLKSEQTSTLAAISAGITFLFFSNALIAMESMPLWISRIVRLNPFILSENTLRNVIIFKESPFGIDLYVLIGFCIIILAVNLKLLKRKE